MKWREKHIGDARLILGDCLEILPTLGKVDAVVTDPPYGVGFAEWDGSRPPDEWFAEIRRVSPSAAVHAVQGEIWGWPQPDWIMAWFMPGSVNRTKRGNFRHWEPVLVYGEERAVVDSRVFPPKGGERNGHPCPKPDAIARWLVRDFAREGETILDPFMGSGTTGVACAKLGRKFIGIEIHEPYFDIACKRIEEAYKQSDLFIEPPKKAEQLELSAASPLPAAQPPEAAPYIDASGGGEG